MSLEDIAKANADKTRLDRMKRVTKPKPSIQNATYLGKAEDGTDIVQVDGQIGETSGHRLISNKSMAIGDRVQLRPSSNGLQRVDAKNQPPVINEVTEEKDVLYFWFDEIEYYSLLTNDLVTYEFYLEAKGSTNLAVKGGAIGATFEFKPDGGSYASITLSETETPLSGSGTLKITYANPDQEDFKDGAIFFYNGKVAEKARAVVRFKLFDYRDTRPTLESSQVTVNNRFIANPNLGRTTKNKIKVGYTVSGAWNPVFDSLFAINTGISEISPNGTGDMEFVGFPTQLPIGIFHYAPPINIQTITLKRNDRYKSVGIKGLDKMTFAMLPQPAKMRYRFDDLALRNTALGDAAPESTAPTPTVDDAGFRILFNASGITDSSWGSTTAVDKYSKAYWDGFVWTLEPVGDDYLIQQIAEVLVTDTAPVSPSKGDLYVFTNSGTADGSWGLTESVERFDQVLWDGTVWLFEPIGYYFYAGLDTDANSIRSGALSRSLPLSDTITSYTQSGLSLTINLANPVTSYNQTFVFFALTRWLEFDYRYGASYDNELLTIEATCNEQVLTQDFVVSSSELSATFSFIDFAEASTLNLSIRFKRQSGSNWFQV